jgi:hypothetical protein
MSLVFIIICAVALAGAYICQGIKEKGRYQRENDRF